MYACVNGCITVFPYQNLFLNFVKNVVAAVYLLFGLFGQPEIFRCENNSSVYLRIRR